MKGRRKFYRAALAFNQAWRGIPARLQQRRPSACPEQPTSDVPPPEARTRVLTHKQPILTRCRNAQPHPRCRLWWDVAPAGLCPSCAPPISGITRQPAEAAPNQSEMVPRRGRPSLTAEHGLCDARLSTSQSLKTQKLFEKQAPSRCPIRHIL